MVPSQICLGKLARVPEPFNGTAMTWLQPAGCRPRMGISFSYSRVEKSGLAGEKSDVGKHHVVQIQHVWPELRSWAESV